MTSTMPCPNHIDTYTVNGRTVTLSRRGDAYAVYVTLGFGGTTRLHTSELDAAKDYLAVANRIFERYGTL